MLKRFVLAASLAAAALQAQAPSGNIEGRITDSGGGVLAGARVELQSGASTVSSVQGEFRFVGVGTGNQDVTVSFVGFSPLTKTVAVAAGKPAAVEFVLEVATRTEQLLVTAERLHGEAEAINRTWTSENIVQILPHDVIVSLPNANIADALGRLPGVTLERDEGEGKYVQIRGGEPRYSNVTIDGVNVPSAENTRVVKLDVLPSDLVESVEISKTLLASMDGDAIGGSVNLRTKSAGEKPLLSLFGMGGYTPIVNGRSADQFGGVASQRFGTQKRLGILFGGTYDWNGRGIDDIEPGPQTINCDPNNCSDPSAKAPAFATFGGTDLREYRYYRTRWGLSGSVDYKFSDSANIYAHWLYSNFKNFGDRWVYSTAINSYTKSPFQGDTDGQTTFNASIRRPLQTTGSLALGGQKYFRSSWISWEASASRASTEDKGYSQANFSPIADDSPLNNVKFGVDLTDPNRPKFPVQNGVNIYDPKGYFLKSLDFNTLYSPQVNLQGGASFTQNYALGGHAAVFELGGKFRNAHKFNDANDIYYTAVNPGSLPLSNFTGSFTNSNYYDNSYQFGPTADYNKIKSYFDGTPAAFKVNVQTTLQRNEPQKYRLVEQISSGYLQNSVSFGRFRLYTGLRLEATNESVTGNLVQINKAGNYVATIASTKSSSYVDPLPSVQLRYSVGNNSAIRLAYGRGIARPDFNSLPPYLTVNDKKNSVSAGNPSLKATHANNYDILFESSLKPLGLFQAGFFYKDISDPIYFVNTGLTSGAYSGYSQTQPINGTSAWLWGFEVGYQQRLGFLPGPLSGTGISANYSYTDSQASGLPGRRDHPALQRQAPHTWNISPTWDRGRVSIRVGLSYNAANIYQYTYKDGADLGLSGPNGDNYLYSHLQVDAQGSVRLAHGLTAVVYGLNLTNEVFGFYNGSAIYPNQREFYKATYGAGMRWNSGEHRRN